MEHTESADNTGGEKNTVPGNDSLQKFLHTSISRGHRKRLVALVQIDAMGHEKISLGIYGSDFTPKGFFLEYIPDLKAMADSKIVSLSAGQSSMYELKLIMANYAQETITAKVWEIE